MLQNNIVVAFLAKVDKWKIYDNYTAKGIKKIFNQLKPLKISHLKNKDN